MRVLVCGGRNYSDVAAIWRALDSLNEAEGVDMVIDGASDDVTGPYIGADYWANQWAKAHRVRDKRVHAAWKAYGRAAGPLRNAHMLDEHKPDLVIAFPGGDGTADMVRRALAAGVKVERRG